MLHGALLFPGVPDESFIHSLHSIKGVKWEALISTLGKDNAEVTEELLTENCNMINIFDPDFTTFGFLSGLVRQGCHLFLPEIQRMNSTERMNLIQLAEEGNSLIQIRNDLLFHPSFEDKEKMENDSKLIEIHQVAPNRPDALQEILYSNLLMIMRLVNSDPSHISVCAIPNSVYPPNTVNLHLKFNNGSAATLTISFKGRRKEHLLSVYGSGGVLNYNFEGKINFPPAMNPGIKNSQSFGNNLLYKQITYFSECILKKDCKRFALNDEAKTFLLIEKINQKLEYSSVLN